MIREYTMDPELVATAHPADLRYLKNELKLHRGRALLEYPSDWSKKAMTEVRNSNLKPMQRKKAVQVICGFEFFSDSKNRSFAEEKSWLDNAFHHQDSGQPFDGVIAGELESTRSDIILASSPEDQDCWRAETQKAVGRTPEELVKATEFLLAQASQFKFIDPYFDASNPRTIRPLIEMLKLLKARDKATSCLELHCLAKDYPSYLADFKKGAENQFGSNLKADAIMECYIWKPRHTGERFHRRMILTEIGGLNFEGGIDAGRRGETTDVFLLEPNLRQQRWEDYVPQNDVFQLISQFEIN